MENETAAAIANFAPIALMILIFYFLLYRPQKKARQERDEMLGNLKIGVEIVTIGGIYGTISELNEEFLKIRVADNVEIKISKNAVGSLAVKEKTET